MNTVIAAGLEVLHVAEHAEPFWRTQNFKAAGAWQGRLPNSFSLPPSEQGRCEVARERQIARRPLL